MYAVALCRTFELYSARVNIQPCTVLRTARSPPSSGKAGCAQCEVS